MAYAPFLAWRRRFAFGHGAIRRGGGPWGAEIQVASSTKRAPLRLIARVAGAATIIVAFTATVSAQSGSDFLNNIDPLFAGVVAHPGNLDNTIAYAASAAAHGDIESAIIIPGLPRRATSSACFIISLAHTLRRAAICKPRCRCRTSHRSFAKRSRICSISSTKSCSPINSPVSRKPACAIRAMPVSAPDRRPFSLPAER
jgi:hypothetical protein